MLLNPQFIDKNYDFLNKLPYTESKNMLSYVMSNKNNFHVII